MTTRRDFLLVVGAGAMCTAVPGCGPGTIDAGNATDLADGELKKLEGSQVFLGRDAGGIYAMTSLCTHYGCDMSEESGVIAADFSQIECIAPCGHGSRFARDGAVVQGPATDRLRHWRVTVAADGAIQVEVGTDVPEDERAVVS